MTSLSSNHARRASVLVGLLWCLALLSVVVIGVLHSSRLELMVVKNHGDRIQAHYLALAGIEKAKALLYQEAMDRRRTHKNHTGQLYNAPQELREVPLGRGLFSIVRQGRQEEGGSVIYGVSDEESRLNVNNASAEELGKIEGMTPAIVAAIQDWKDQDDVTTPGGAEVDYYASLQPPYIPRNGPFQTVRELLMVRGVSRELLCGEDANQNGLLDPEENDGNDSYPPDNHDGFLDAGWSGMLTVDSSVKNVNAAGEDRVNIQSGDESALSGVKGLSSDLAKAIVAYRGQNQLQSLADLLDVVAVQNRGQNPAQGGPTGDQGGLAPPPPQGGPSSNSGSGEKLISQDLLLEIADDLTVDSGQDLPGVVNINTASADVLICLPGIEQPLAEAIIAYRQSSGFFSNVAWLLKVPGMTQQLFKQIAPRVTARSETFRILSEGKIKSTGARQRIQVIVHIGSRSIETLSYREDL
jgi:competence ComEA-like helix-hairpin-helix protein